MRPLMRFPIMVAVILCAAQFTIHAGMATEVTTENEEINEDDLEVLPIKSDTSDMEAAERVRQLLTSSKGFLAGEDTPVWVAYRPNDTEPVSYRKLRRGIVKEAIDYWKAGKFDTLEISHPGIQSDITLPMYDSQEFGTKVVKENDTERSDPDPGVLHLSLLVTMDYKIDWPTSETAQKKIIMERILYALAFWNGVDLQLRHLQDPKVRLRVSGIVIGSNKEATPYLRESSGLLGLSVEPSLGRMLKYWRKVADINKDFFSPSSYNAVAAMTELSYNREVFEIFSETRVSRDCTAPTSSRHLHIYARQSDPAIYKQIYVDLGIATSGPPCVSSGTFIAGIVISDDNAFTGIQTAVHEAGHLLGESGHDGDTADCPEVTGHVHAQTVNNYGRHWSECSLTHISSRLHQSGSTCMKEPKEYHPPGKPIGIILPGRFMPASKLCKARGWQDGNVCWESSTCDKLYCSNNHSLSPCKDAGPMPDGTTCARGKVCLDGLCISNTTLAFL